MSVTRRIDPSALTTGEPFAVLRVGAVYDMDGNELPGNVASFEQLQEMERYFRAVQEPSGQYPLIDYDHKAVGGLTSLLPASLDERMPLGACVDVRAVDDALVVTPAWTKHGRSVMDKAEGLWHPSATYRLEPTADRATGEIAANAAFLAFAVTPQPATRPDVLGAVRSLNDSPAAQPAPHKEVRAMTRDETLAAYRALSEEDQAAFMKAVVPDPEPDERAEEMDDLEERAQQAQAEAATARSANEQLIAQLRETNERLARLEKADHVARRSAAVAGVAPALRSAAEAIFDAQGAEAVQSMFADHMVRTDVIGKDGQPKADSVPTDEAGFVAYVRSNLNEGESFTDGLARIRAAFPDKYRAAVTSGVSNG